MISKLSVQGTVRCRNVFSVILGEVFILGFRERKNLFLRCVFSGGEEIFLMLRVLLQMFDLLLAVEHLPALNAEHFAIRLCLYHF